MISNDLKFCKKLSTYWTYCTYMTIRTCNFLCSLIARWTEMISMVSPAIPCLIKMAGTHNFRLVLPSLISLKRLTGIFFVYSCNLWFYYKANMYILCLFPQSLILLWDWPGYSLFIPAVSDFTTKADRYILCLFPQSLILLRRLTGIFFVYSCNLWFYYEADM
jgi:hypothetical protein